jgi:pantothenate synthetase
LLHNADKIQRRRPNVEELVVLVVAELAFVEAVEAVLRPLVASLHVEHVVVVGNLKVADDTPMVVVDVMTFLQDFCSRLEEYPRPFDVDSKLVVKMEVGRMVA